MAKQEVPTPDEELRKLLESVKRRSSGGQAGWIIRAIIAIFVFSFLADTGIFSLLPINLTRMGGAFAVIGIILFVLLISIRQVNQYERGVKFQLGRFRAIADPGWRIVLPIVQSMVKVDIRVKAVDVPFQETITKDNVSARVNAVLYYKVIDSKRAVIDVENYMFAVSQLAQTTMRNVVGEMSLDELLANRDQAADKIRLIVDKASDPWGLKVESVDLKDIILPEDMARVIAKQAEAEREKRAVIIKAEGEVTAANNLQKAASMLSSSPGALHLRTLNTLNDLSSDQSNTVVFAVPIEVLRAFERFTTDGQK